VDRRQECRGCGGEVDVWDRAGAHQARTRLPVVSCRRAGCGRLNRSDPLRRGTRSRSPASTGVATASRPACGPVIRHGSRASNPTRDTSPATRSRPHRRHATRPSADRTANSL
jgi:hypothetical protein